MLIAAKKRAQFPEYMINSQLLKNVDGPRDLVFTITSGLCFSKNCRMLVKKASYRPYNTFRVLKSVQEERPRAVKQEAAAAVFIRKDALKGDTALGKSNSRSHRDDDEQEIM